MPDAIELTPESFDTAAVLAKAFEGKTGTPAPPNSVPPPAAVVPDPTKPADKPADKPVTPEPKPAPKTDAGPSPEEFAGLAGANPVPDPTPAPAPVQSDALKKIEDVQLSPHAQPKTAESFATVKTLAKEEIGRLSTELASLRGKIAELEKAPKADPNTVAVTEAEKKELEELRAFRAGIQLRGDPAFSERFEKPLAALDEQFYAQLKAAGASDKNVADIKAMGGLDKVDVGALLEAAPATNRRLLEAILRKRDDVRLSRDDALGQSEEKLKQEVEKFRKERETAEVRSGEAVQKGIDTLLPQVPDLQKYQVPATADETTRKNIQAANDQIEATLKEARAMAARNDPETRAQLGVLAALSVVHRLRASGLRSALVKAKSDLEAATKAHTDEVTALKAQLEKLKGASRIGGGGREVLKPTDTKPVAEVPFGATATAAFQAYEQARAARE